MKEILLSVVALAALALVAGCGSDGAGKECTAGSIGTCNEGSIACAIKLSCADSVPRELKCTPPDTKLPMACDCMEAGKSVAKVSMETVLPPGLDQALALVKLRCAW